MNPEESALWQRLGAARYRAGDFGGAADAFAEWGRLTGGTTQDAAEFNEGNALYKAGRFEEALERYGRVLERSPEHVGAKSNQAVVQADLEARRQQRPPEQQQQQQQQQQGADSQEQQQQQQQPGDESQFNNSPPSGDPNSQASGQQETDEQQAEAANQREQSDESSEAERQASEAGFQEEAQSGDEQQGEAQGEARGKRFGRARSRLQRPSGSWMALKKVAREPAHPLVMRGTDRGELAVGTTVDLVAGRVCRGCTPGDRSVRA